MLLLLGKPLRGQESLFPVLRSGKWGYIDAAGKIVVDPQYYRVSQANEGRLIVWENPKRCLILDSKGRYICDSPFWQSTVIYRNGFIKGPVENGYRFADRSGKLLPGVFTRARDFSDGFAAVSIEHFHVLNEDKKSHNLVPKWGFIDTSGELVVSPNYLAVGDFVDGLAPVYVGGRLDQYEIATGGMWAFINPQGTLEIEPRFTSAASFSEGLAKVGFGDMMIGYIDQKGNLIIKPRRLQMAGDFHEELVAIGGSGFGFMNRSGEVVIDEKYSDVSDFSEGLAAVRTYPSDGMRNWGYIDKSGNWIIEPQFDWARPFRGGLAMVGLGSKIGYIDRKGRLVWPFTD